jgi:hypothetical protein
MAIAGPDGQHYYVAPETGVTPNASMLYYDPRCTYMFGESSLFALNGYSSNFFGPESNLTSPYNVAGDTDGPIWLERLYLNGTADMNTTVAYMQGLAHAVTAVIRKNGDAEHNLPVTGTVFGAQTCIAITWGWLALPAALLLLTLIFMCATVLRAHHATSVSRNAAEAGRRSWKSSTLPLLWCGLSDETRRSYGTLDSVYEMREYGDELFVCLRRDSDARRREQQPDKVEEEISGRWTLSKATTGLHQRAHRSYAED